MDDARRHCTEALDVAAEPTDGRPWWIAHNTLAFLVAADADEAEWDAHLTTMEAHSAATGDPLAAPLANFDRALIATMAGAPERGRRARPRRCSTWRPSATTRRCGRWPC